MHVTFVVFTDSERCTRPICTNPGYMEAGEYGLTRGTCFVARRLEVVAVAGLLWISWCVLGGADFFVFFFFAFCFFFERTRRAVSMRPPCLIYLSSSTGERTGCHYLLHFQCGIMFFFRQPLLFVFLRSCFEMTHVSASAKFLVAVVTHVRGTTCVANTTSTFCYRISGSIRSE